MKRKKQEMKALNLINIFCEPYEKVINEKKKKKK